MTNEEKAEIKARMKLGNANGGFAVMLLSANNSGVKDGRYKDGTKGNERSRNVAMVLMLISLLIAPLIKGKKIQQPKDNSC